MQITVLISQIRNQASFEVCLSKEVSVLSAIVEIMCMSVQNYIGVMNVRFQSMKIVAVCVDMKQND